MSWAEVMKINSDMNTPLNEMSFGIYTKPLVEDDGEKCIFFAVLPKGKKVKFADTVIATANTSNLSKLSDYEYEVTEDGDVELEITGSTAIYRQLYMII